MNNDTTKLILKNLIKLAKDVDAIKKSLFNGMLPKVDALWAWKEEYPTRCNFLIWMQEHPQIEKMLGGKKRPVGKPK